MPFCSRCGVAVTENDKFCKKCGAKLTSFTAPVREAPAPQMPVVNQPVYRTDKDFSRITVRYRCPNGHVFDGNERDEVCPDCGAPLNKGGYIQMYRMGNYSGWAVGMGIYIDGAPTGHIANKQSLRISVPYGPHKVHVTHTTTHACNDPVFTVSPEVPYVWCKAHFSKAGFAITVEPSDPDSMPEE